MNDVKRLVTHSGSFHADDVFSFVVLSRLFPHAKLLRTRDESIFQNAGLGDIVFDVGMIYDPMTKRYDHHQKDKPTRDGEHPYSSIGLVWKDFGIDYLRSSVFDDEKGLQRIWDYIDQSFIFPIDCADNGKVPTVGPVDSGPLSLPLQLENFNPVFDDPDPDYDGAFLRAARFAGAILENKIMHTAAYYRQRPIVEQALAETDDLRVITLSKSCNWEAHLREMGVDEVLFAIYPAHGNWNCSAAKISEESFENKKSFPEDWAGLRNDELAKATGVPDAIFCHTGLFVCVAGSLEGVSELARQAITYDASAKMKR
jgi:uncharacterized UPF0160 family protein